MLYCSREKSLNHQDLVDQPLLYQLLVAHLKKENKEQLTIMKQTRLMSMKIYL